MDIRSAAEADLPSILGSYKEVIVNTTAIYAEQPAELADRAAWFRSRQEQSYPVIVAADGGSDGQARADCRD
jgi:L-amino acid N-acyltransferase